MRFIRELNNTESKLPQVRDRAKCIILSDQRFSLKELELIFGVSGKTIYNWLTFWGIPGNHGNV